MAELKGEGKYDGVFGLWYGKGPGVDRCGDVFRHANIAGSSPLGGVLVAMGDDHTGESSTTLHQSEMALMDAMMPILSPAGVQELLDYCITGWALSRYSGLWVGIKCMKDTIEATAVVDGRPERVEVALPSDFDMPEGGLNIPIYEEPFQGEDRMHDYKRFAAQAFARANNLDGRTHGAPGAKVGIVTAGKSWLDVCHALELLGIDQAEAERIGLTVYKVGMVWPLEPQRLTEWAEGLGADHRRRGKAHDHRDPAEGNPLQRPAPPVGGRLEGRGRRGAVLGQEGPRPRDDRPGHRPAVRETGLRDRIHAPRHGRTVRGDAHR